MEQICTKIMFIDTLQPPTSIGIRKKTQFLMSAIFKDTFEIPIF